MHKIIGTILLASHATVMTRSPSSIEGSYVATSLNGRALPAQLTISALEGDVRLFQLEQGVLRLSPGGRFTLYFRYYHQLVRRGNQPTKTPVLSESETGTYTVENQQLVLVPTRKENARRRPTIIATISGREIRASYVLDRTSGQKRVALVLRRDESFW